MTGDIAAFQALLAGMREDFLVELSERCGKFEEAILALSNAAGEPEVFNELYREVHSLKGLGGTHGVPVISAICHQFENQLSDALDRREFGDIFIDRAFALVDLLRRAQTVGLEKKPDFAPIEASLEGLRQAERESRKVGLIAESSAMMAGFYQQALADLPVQLTMEANGLSALELLLREPFDFIIVGRELTELNGIALMSALRAARARNQDIPAILVTSNRDTIPAHAGFNGVILRDQRLADELHDQVTSLVF